MQGDRVARALRPAWSSVQAFNSHIMWACEGLQLTSTELASFATNGVHLFMHAYRRLVAAAVTGDPGAPVLERRRVQDIPALEPSLLDPAFAAILVCTVNTSSALPTFSSPLFRIQLLPAVAPDVGQDSALQTVLSSEPRGASRFGEIGVWSARQEAGRRPDPLVPAPHAVALGAQELAVP